MTALRAVPDQPERAILYLRQSITRDDSVSLELQETAGRDYATRRGYQIVDVVEDPGRTGRTLARRQVLATVERIRQREAEVIIVWRWSRLARSRRDFAVVCDEVATLGGRIESATEPIDVTTASGRLARGMMAEVAAWESELKGEVWSEVHEQRRRRGVPHTGGPRFGYVRDGDTYTIDPTTGPALAQMYRWYLDGTGLSLIAHRLNTQGVPTLWGGQWGRVRVTRVLDSGFGAGLIVKGNPRSGTVTYLPAAHPPVITPTEWAQYRRMRQARTTPIYSSEPAYLPSGLLRCGDCGQSMHAASLSVRRGYGYVCSRWTAGKTCRCVTVTRAKAERAILAWLAHEVAQDVEQSAARAAIRDATAVTARITAADLARQITALDGELVELTRGLTRGLIPDAVYATTRDQIEVARGELVDQLARAERRIADSGKARPKVTAQLVRDWPDLTVTEQRSILLPLVSSIRVLRPATRGPVALEIVPVWGDAWTYVE